MTDLYEDLKQKNSSQTVQEEAGKRLKNIKDEVDRMKRAMEDKDKQIQGSPPFQFTHVVVQTEQCACADAINNGKFCVPST